MSLDLSEFLPVEAHPGIAVDAFEGEDGAPARGLGRAGERCPIPEGAVVERFVDAVDVVAPVGILFPSGFDVGDEDGTRHDARHPVVGLGVARSNGIPFQPFGGEHLPEGAVEAVKRQDVGGSGKGRKKDND